MGIKLSFLLGHIDLDSIDEDLRDEIITEVARLEEIEQRLIDEPVKNPVPLKMTGGAECYYVMCERRNEAVAVKSTRRDAEEVVLNYSGGPAYIVQVMAPEKGMCQTIPVELVPKPKGGAS